jgi:hypothetical protein
MKKIILLSVLVLIAVIAFCQTEKEVKQGRTRYYCTSMSISATTTFLARNTKCPFLYGFASSLILNFAHQAMTNGKVGNWRVKNLNASLFGTVAGGMAVCIPLSLFYHQKKVLVN